MIVTFLLPCIFLLAILAFQSRGRIAEVQFMSIAHTNALRGLAIICIMCMHASCDAGARVLTTFGGIGVALFLLLSGYGLSISFQRFGIRCFWRKKLIRIWMPYALFIVALTLIRGDFSHFFSYDFLLDFACLRTSYWYISFLIYNYILFYLTHRYALLNQYKYVLFGLLAVGLLCFDTRIRAEQALSFVSGIWIANNTERAHHIAQSKWSFMWLFVSALALLCKQVPIVRDLYDCDRVLASLIDMMVKFPFAIWMLVQFTPNCEERRNFIVHTRLSYGILCQVDSWRIVRKFRWSCI